MGLIFFTPITLRWLLSDKFDEALAPWMGIGGRREFPVDLTSKHLEAASTLCFDAANYGNKELIAKTVFSLKFPH